ncbi:AAA family ATPase [Streptomyces sp. NPDC056549]|uniref:AAA family ATPase n=1 Tax=Streptomyces sp. NPDC056549 TaxID=3345864 RepID=UPI0036C1C010
MNLQGPPTLAENVASRTRRPPSKPRAILMSGMPGAGKTRLAHSLEQGGFQRLSPDEEMFRRYGCYGRDFPRGEFRIREAPILVEIRLKLQELLKAGQDTVIDHGFWTLEERAEWAAAVMESGGLPVLIYLPVPHQIRWERIRKRNAYALYDANAIEFSEADLIRFADRFMPPSADEPHLIYRGDEESFVAEIIQFRQR